MRAIIRRLLARLRRPPSQGKCAHCGEDVRHGYPWWTGSPHKGGQPLHDECVSLYGLFDRTEKKS